jgi:hypothetical protein
MTTIAVNSGGFSTEAAQVNSQWWQQLMGALAAAQKGQIWQQSRTQEDSYVAKGGVGWRRKHNIQYLMFDFIFFMPRGLGTIRVKNKSEG